MTEADVSKAQELEAVGAALLGRMYASASVRGGGWFRGVRFRWNHYRYVWRVCLYYGLVCIFCLAQLAPTWLFYFYARRVKCVSYERCGWFKNYECGKRVFYTLVYLLLALSWILLVISVLCLLQYFTLRLFLHHSQHDLVKFRSKYKGWLSKIIVYAPWILGFINLLWVLVVAVIVLVLLIHPSSSSADVTTQNLALARTRNGTERFWNPSGLLAGTGALDEPELDDELNLYRRRRLPEKHRDRLLGSVSNLIYGGSAGSYKGGCSKRLSAQGLQAVLNCRIYFEKCCSKSSCPELSVPPREKYSCNSLPFLSSHGFLDEPLPYARLVDVCDLVTQPVSSEVALSYCDTAQYTIEECFISHTGYSDLHKVYIIIVGFSGFVFVVSTALLPIIKDITPLLGTSLLWDITPLESFFFQVPESFEAWPIRFIRKMFTPWS
ncbi:putative transmembrane protein [Gregarina niphandrodes]|uniref:Transmembrane protein n=1 Tax=Gregarina niphandrodes TaxID=110365 RepID=A0A023B440_GRENI|nr:putative transmembrane protein [Gregarina niphandrodes]EZG55941.1 putative transmembrane protein [Gregarina niphandrodes]|eukprot:XP_011131398.1 putative transmembrane protein [Gregarina niphandrodes]